MPPRRQDGATPEDSIVIIRAAISLRRWGPLILPSAGRRDAFERARTVLIATELPSSWSSARPAAAESHFRA